MTHSIVWFQQQKLMARIGVAKRKNILIPKTYFKGWFGFIHLTRFCEKASQQFVDKLDKVLLLICSTILLTTIIYS